MKRTDFYPLAIGQCCKPSQQSFLQTAPLPLVSTPTQECFAQRITVLTEKTQYHLVILSELLEKVTAVTKVRSTYTHPLAPSTTSVALQTAIKQLEKITRQQPQPFAASFLSRSS